MDDRYPASPRSREVEYNGACRKRKSMSSARFADDLLSGKIRRLPPPAERSSPSKDLRRLMPPLGRLLARADGDAIDRR